MSTRNKTGGGRGTNQYQIKGRAKEKQAKPKTAAALGQVANDTDSASATPEQRRAMPSYCNPDRFDPNVPEEREWMRFCDTKTEMKAWLECGFTQVAQVGVWKRYRFKPKEAQAWREAGFGAFRAAKYHHLYSYWQYTPEEAQACLKNRELRRRHSSFTEDVWFEHKQSPKWVAQGFSPEEARECWGAGLNLELALEWREAGFNAYDAILGYRYNLEPTVARRGKRLGYSLEEVQYILIAAEEGISHRDTANALLGIW